jgi:hypothetical protein
MKKILFLLFIATTFVACQKEDQNGDLGGFWKIMEIEEHATGTTTYLTDKSHFWGIQLDLLEIRKSDANRHYFRFQHTGDSLFVQKITNQEADMRLWGIYDNNDERFGVLHLNDKSMILNSRNARITFRSF